MAKAYLVPLNKEETEAVEEMIRVFGMTATLAIDIIRSLKLTLGTRAIDMEAAAKSIDKVITCLRNQ